VELFTAASAPCITYFLVFNYVRKIVGTFEAYALPFAGLLWFAQCIAFLQLKLNCMRQDVLFTHF